MKPYINEEKYRIEITCDNFDETKKVVRALDQVVLGKGKDRSSRLEGCLTKLNNTPDRIQFAFNKDELIYFDKKSIAYTLNYGSSNFYFPIMKTHLKKAIELIDELKEQNIYDKIL